MGYKKLSKDLDCDKEKVIGTEYFELHHSNPNTKLKSRNAWPLPSYINWNESYFTIGYCPYQNQEVVVFVRKFYLTHFKYDHKQAISRQLRTEVVQETGTDWFDLSWFKDNIMDSEFRVRKIDFLSIPECYES